MTTTYYVYNIVPIGLIFLLIYIFIDLFMDYFRKEKKSNLKRFILYCFIFYLISLIQINLGGITLPQQNSNDINSQFIASNEWYGIYEGLFSKISIGSNSLGIIYNLLIFIPFGIFLSVLIGIGNLKKQIFIVILSCIGIGFLHLLLEWFGLVLKTTNGIDVLYMAFNIIGGVLGIFIVKLVFETLKSKYFFNKSKLDF